MVNLKRKFEKNELILQPPSQRRDSAKTRYRSTRQRLFQVQCLRLVSLKYKTDPRRSHTSAATSPKMRSDDFALFPAIGGLCRSATFRKTTRSSGDSSRKPPTNSSIRQRATMYGWIKSLRGLGNYMMSCRMLR